MTDPRVVANYILFECRRRNLRVTNLSLQKLIYFAHAIMLVEKKRPLVSVEFEAWQYGPVLPSVYQALKSFGSSSVDQPITGLNPVTREQKTLEELDDLDSKDVCNRVVMSLAHLSPGRLVDLTHATEGPWDFVVKQATERANLGLRISNEVIAERFGKHKVSIKEYSIVGEPDEDSPFI